MSCRACTTSVFWQKLGRCRRCTIQLAIASPIAWLVWAIFYRSQPATIEAITVFIAASSCSLLLLAHGLRALQLKYKKAQSS
ncbi:DUF3624 domain-containing protein [Photobacterium nomapromontoriensis]|uniref:DUF3624 domain-containing protein n=1 Tax=Photobacterium nomapromontoriensis TaxID=2910237 RepID=UPI003D0F4D3C